MLNVLHYTFSFLPTTCTWLYPQITLTEGVCAHVLTHKREQRESFPFKEVTTVKPTPVTAYKDIRLLQRYAYRQQMAHTLKHLNPSLIHAHFGREGACLVPLARQRQIPMLVSFYGFDLALHNYRWFRNRYRKMFNYASVILCEGPFARQKVIALGCPENKTHVLRLGVDLNAIPYCPRKNTGGSTTIFMASTFREKKGIKYGLRAFARCISSFPDTRLVLQGDGPLRSQIERCIRIEGLGDHVELTGYQTYEAFKAQLYQSDLFLAPSVTASDGDTEGGSPVSITEAAASGLPIVSTKHADIPEVVLHGKNGFLAPERDEKMLAEHLHALLGSEDTRIKMGAAGRKHIEDNFSQQHQLRQLVKHYQAASAK